MNAQKASPLGARRPATAALLAALCLAAAPAGATDRHVPAQYATIQAAIDAAANGDTIYVAAGTYTSTTDPVVNWNGKSIALVGAGAGQTIIDGQNDRRCLNLVNVPATARMEGFTVTGANADGGGGMLLERSSLMLTNNTFTDNRATVYGGGMFLDRSSPTLTNNTFTGNSATNLGGGMHISSSSPTLTNNTFTGNSATDSGGMFLSSSSSPMLANNTFTGNSADRGGGMQLWCSSPTLTSNTFTGNSAAWDGGGMLLLFSSPTLTSNTFTGNSAGEYGGGMCLDRSSPTLTNNTIANNTGGWGVYVLGSDTPVITNCILWGNAGGDLAGPATQSHNYVGGANPGFVGADDLHLAAGSPCIGAGTSTGAPSIDKDGVIRPDPPAIGAYEYTDGTLPTVADSLLTADPTTLPAIGTGTSTITMQLPDTRNDPTRVVALSKTGAGILGAVSYAGNGAYTATLTAPPVLATGSATITATVNGLPVTQTATVTFTNTAPVLALIGSRTINANQNLTFTSAATDAEAPDQTLTFSLIGEPMGASINPTTGAFSWMPGAGQVGDYTFTVRVMDDCTPALSDEEQITVTVRPVLAFTVQPATSVLMQNIAPAVEVSVVDGAGDPVAGRSDVITIALAAGPAGARLYGTATATAVDGVARFPNLRLSRLGCGCRLAASSGTLAGATSDAFNIVSGAPASLRFVSQPAGGTAGTAMPAFQVEVLDGCGRRVTTGTHAVKLTLSTNPGRALLTGATTVNTVNGMATFDNVVVSKPGAGCVLSATAPRLSGVRSAAFTVASAP